MWKITWGASLFIALIAAGCGSSRLHQSLLLNENRRLEDALYTAHAQVADLKRENDTLRKQQENDSLEPSGRSPTGSWDDDLDIIPPLEMPKVILPHEPGKSEIPEALKGSQTIPLWSPRR